MGPETLRAVITDVSRPETNFQPDDVAPKLPQACNNPRTIDTTVDQEMSLTHSGEGRAKLGDILGLFREKD